MKFKDNGVHFQQVANAIGSKYEDCVVDFLVSKGWQVVQRNVQKQVGFAIFEIDIIAKRPNNDEIWIECKSGSEDTLRKNPGLLRLDTCQKAIGKAFGLSFIPNKKPYWIITSHMPNAGTQGKFLLEMALEAGYINKIWLVKFDGEMETVEEYVKYSDQLAFDL